MKRAYLFIALVTLVFVSLPSIARAQAENTASAVPIDYKPGQLWKYKTALGAEGSTVLILSVESGKKGNVIHVRIDDMPIPSCGGFHLTTSIEHLALTEKILRKSTTELLKDKVELPDSYFQAYRDWQKGRHEVVNHPLSEVALPAPAGPMICNWRQSS